MSVLHRIPIEVIPSLNGHNNAYTYTNGTAYDIGGCKARISSSRIGYDWRLIKAGVNDKLYVQIFGTNDDFVSEIQIPENVYPDVDSLIIALNNGLASSAFQPMQPNPDHFIYNSTKVDFFNYPGSVRFERRPGSDTEIQFVAINGITIRALPNKDLSDKNKNQSINKVLGNYKLGETTGTTRTQFFLPVAHQHLDLSIEILNLKTMGSLGADGQSHFNSHVHVTANHGGMIVSQDHGAHPVHLSVPDQNHYINTFDCRLIDTYSNEVVDKVRPWSFVLEFLK